MDIILTAIASVLMIIGFFVICRTSDEDEDEFEDEEPTPTETEDKSESSQL